ncbi:MAG: hypothetical protein WCX71_04860 [Candidatus Buchananbacteria bacterium]
MNTIDDALFQTLAELWKETHNVWQVIYQIREELSLTTTLPHEQILLYGRSHEDKANETAAGWLIAVAPGVVIFNPMLADNVIEEYLPLTGQLRRSQPNWISLFQLRPFDANASMGIYPASFPPRRKRQQFTRCPAWFKADIGNDNAIGKLGIEPERWQTMQTWLDKWLPTTGDLA